MLKRKAKISIIMVIVFGIIIIMASFAFVNAERKKAENPADITPTHKYEVTYSTSQLLSDLVTQKSNITPGYITGEFDLDGETITFGLKNNLNQNLGEFQKNILNTVAGTIARIQERKSLDQATDTPVDVPVKVQRLLFYGSKEEMLSIKNDFEADPNVLKGNVIDIQQQKNFFRRFSPEQTEDGPLL